MTLETFAAPTFAAHQTFHPRFGWIKKAYEAAAEDPDSFNRPDAPVRLGVGKNMVEAIRFWGTATRVIVREKNPERPRMNVAYTSNVGRALLDDKVGLDPYLEDPTSLWMLHWLAIASPTILPVWWSTFNDLTALEFADSDLVEYCANEVASTTWASPNRSSIEKDVDCLLRMYAKRKAKGRQGIDDFLDSPFRSLGLIEPSLSGPGIYRFVRGPKRSMTPTAIVYSCLDYMAMTDPNSRTVSLPRLTADPGSPGRLLKLTESNIQDAIEYVAKRVADISIARPAGTSQLVIEQDAPWVAISVLMQHHGERRPGLPTPQADVAGPGARVASKEQEVRGRTAAEPRRIARLTATGSPR